MALNIAVDGPVGAGKSTAARELARRLGILHLDTGAMYRAVGLAALEAGADMSDRTQIERVNASADVDVTFENGTQRTLLNGRDVSKEIRSPEASSASSMVSVVGAVRAAMLERQRAIAEGTDAVLDGRDIGIRVLPRARFKFYLTASAEIRARRRMDEMRAKGVDLEFERVLADVKERDLRDSTRDIDPLRPAEDAIVIDTSDMTLEEVVERMLEIVRHKDRL
ncbi:MAG: (d)CMP kinase [Oscillospiraceae bacterium]|jgi:cytidylate kinase|nr:(d)CMP kinase [Oscillospiraceae bacterium]